MDHTDKNKKKNCNKVKILKLVPTSANWYQGYSLKYSTVENFLIHSKNKVVP